MSSTPQTRPLPRWFRTFLWVVLGLLGVAGIGALFALLAPSRDIAARLFGTALALGGYSFGALASAYAISRHRWIPLCVLGVAFCVGCVAVVVVLAWGEMGWEIENDLERAWGLLTVWAIFCPHVALLSLARPRPPWGLVVIATQFAALLFAITVTAVILEAYGNPSETVIFIQLALVICGTVASPVLHVLAAAPRVQRLVTTDAAPISVTCPRCRTTQELPLGGAPCTSCGLRISVFLEEERCPNCGYLAYLLTSDACPECGTPLRPAAGATTSTLMRSGSSQNTA